MGKRGPQPLKRKEFCCINCKDKFTVNYISEKSNKIIKRCKNCDYNFKISQGFFNDKVDYIKLYNDIFNYIKNKKEPVTFEFLIRKFKISTITFRNCMKINNSSFQKMFDEIGIKTNKRSKFQHSVFLILKKYFKDIIQEYKIQNKFVDFYIPSLNIAIECDGNQHYDENNYFNKLSKSKGYITSIESDIIKEKYCKENNIKMIRIPYHKNITIKYIKQYIDLRKPNTEG